ncbi:MAG TPA: peptide-methionine (S)-S-oxide reductase MsrA [Candidatus Saccharibacteria bacterium]|jgi:peptide-methionine (S)-S-oxide reductase|nr:peptide-methionine (S)-S-oxide reductase [Patescibacteria group bacterium]HMS31564.1 peptide-methionine (S)-S-oxide reductase MsrA [Candidatus Saccharibacteria bacterium]
MNTESIVLGGGCFWCLEAVYQRVKGVKTVTNGYTGGTVPNPTYEQVCTGTTGHAEVVKIEYDPSEISLQTLLQIFWVVHDPTTLNQQGADIGAQYRSAIFYQSEEQQKISEKSLQHDGQPLWPAKIVTQITKLVTFYEAENYHRDYFNNHPEAAYCQIIINPKVAKLKQKFSAIMR